MDHGNKQVWISVEIVVTGAHAQREIWMHIQSPGSKCVLLYNSHILSRFQETKKA